ncbi:MAG: hypothetical protein U1E70_24015 [Acetobacteraceae bacterium]
MLSRLGIALLLVTAGIGGGVLIATVPDIAAAVIVLQLPGVLLWLFDPTPRKAVGRTVLLFQAAASMRPLVSIWYECDGLRQCVGMVTDVRTILIVVLFCGVGFVLTLGLPILVKLIDDRRTKLRHDRLTAERKRLTDEWELS